MVDLAPNVTPNVLAPNAIVIQHVGRAVNHNVGFYQESLAPVVYGSMKRRRIPFIDILWESTLIVSLGSVPLTNGTTL